MMSAFECHLKATRCEDMARSCADPGDRSMLLDMAAIWRKLASRGRSPGGSVCPTRCKPGLE